MGADDYDRAKSVLNKAKHPGFIGRELFFRCATKGRAVLAVRNGADVGVVLVDHKGVLGTLSVIQSAQGGGVGAQLVDHVAAAWVNAIADRVSWFERRGYASVGAPKVGASGKMSTQLMQRTGAPVASVGAPKVGASGKMENTERREWPGDVMACLDEMEIALVAAGFPPMSPWWHDTLREFYGSGKRQLVARVGRRGGKSSTISRVAVAEILTCRHRVPPGDTGVVAVVSVDRREASDRIKTIHAILDALAIPNKPKADGIELPDRPYGIAIRTGSIAGVSGFTCICGLGDEVSKWKDSDTGVNPAEQVLSSWRPTMATMPLAKMFLVSSPMGNDDAHARSFDEGATTRQMIAYAPTWVANPSLTQADLERDEPNRRYFRREYEAIPSPEIEGSLLTAAEIERATVPDAMRVPEVRQEYIAALDTGSRSQVWSLIIATSRWAGPRDRVAVVLAHSWEGTQETRPDAADVLREVGAVLRAYGIHGVRVDKDTTPETLTATAMRAGVALMRCDLQRSDWIKGYDNLALMCSEDAWELPNVEELRADLLTVKKKVTATGTAIEMAKGADQMHAYYSLPLVLATYKGVPAPDEEVRPLTQGEELAAQEARMWAPVEADIAERAASWEYDG